MKKDFNQNHGMSCLQQVNMQWNDRWPGYFYGTRWSDAFSISL